MTPNATEAHPHPMVPVPSAIRCVLETTAKGILSSSSGGTKNVDVKSSQSCGSELLGRIVAEDVFMREPGYPPYRASIMDGYAIRCHEFKTGEKNDGTGTNHLQWTHKVRGRVHAGAASNSSESDSSSKNVHVPSAVYVTTGARVPDTYDCVVPIELIEENSEKDMISISKKATIEPKKWIRNVGCDIPAGSVVIPAGSFIHPVSLGLLQQSGQAEIKLIPKTKVGVLSTGNELLLSTQSWSQQQTNSNDASGLLIQTGQIPDVNKPVLMSLLGSLGNCEPVDLGMERDDDIESLSQTIETAIHSCDVILTTGGISMGETDIVEDVLVKQLGGKLHFGRLNMKPGKPTTFVSLQNKNKTCLIFALPGNPVSATVCTHLLVRPALELLTQYQHKSENDSSKLEEMIQNTLVPPELVATLTHDIKLDMERPEYHRVVLDLKVSSNGVAMEYAAASTGVQRSSRLMSLRDAQGLLVLPKGTQQQPKALAGQQYTVLLVEGNHALVKFKDSKHLNNNERGTSRPPTNVAITQLSEDALKYPLLPSEEVADRVTKALSGSRSGSIMITSNESAIGPLKNIQDYLRDSQASSQADIWIVSCTGSFAYSLQVSATLCGKVGKLADALALQARRGAAAQDGTAALFEAVVGFAKQDSSENGCMLIALPLKGLDGGLGNVRGLLKHAVNVARGKPHNHHHNHHHQKHKH